MCIISKTEYKLEVTHIQALNEPSSDPTANETKPTIVIIAPKMFITLPDYEFFYLTIKDRDNVSKGWEENEIVVRGQTFAVRGEPLMNFT